VVQFFLEHSVLTCCVSVGTLKIMKLLQFVPLPCAREVGEADDDEGNQQNVVLFFATGVICELTSP